MNPTKYLDKLFISKVRIKALKHFLLRPDDPIHLRGAVRELNEEINAVRRELTRLESVGFLLSERRGNRKYFQVNKEFLFFDELQGMIFKSFGLGGNIVKNKSKLGDVKFAALTRSFLLGKVSKNLDLIVVGNGVDMKLLDKLVTEEESRLGKHINYTVLSERDFDLHKRRRDSFVIQILAEDRVMLIGSAEEFATD